MTIKNGSHIVFRVISSIGNLDVCETSASSSWISNSFYVMCIMRINSKNMEETLSFLEN